MAFVRIPNDGREQWLEQRRAVLTATDVARLAHGGPAVWAELKAIKDGGDQPELTGRAIAWGREREPVILGYAQIIEPRLDANADLLVSRRYPQFGATPDAITPDGEVIGEFKTTAGGIQAALRSRYLDQIQWQLLVTGAQYCLFAWEIHHDFTATGYDYELVYPDEQRQEKLIEIAQRFLGGDHSSVVDDLLVEYGHAHMAVEAAAARLEGIKTRIREVVGDTDFEHRSEAGSIVLSYPKPRETVDVKALRADMPEVAEKFTVTSVPEQRTLRVTVPQGGV